MNVVQNYIWNRLQNCFRGLDCSDSESSDESESEEGESRVSERPRTILCCACHSTKSGPTGGGGFSLQASARCSRTIRSLFKAPLHFLQLQGIGPSAFSFLFPIPVAVERKIHLVTSELDIKELGRINIFFTTT